VGEGSSTGIDPDGDKGEVPGAAPGDPEAPPVFYPVRIRADDRSLREFVLSGCRIEGPPVEKPDDGSAPGIGGITQSERIVETRLEDRQVDDVIGFSKGAYPVQGGLFPMENLSLVPLARRGQTCGTAVSAISAVIGSGSRGQEQEAKCHR